MPFPPATTGCDEVIRVPRVRPAAGAMLAAVMLFATACGGSTDPASPSPSESAKQDEAAVPPNFSAELIRSRRDEANERLRIELTNLSAHPASIDEVRLVAPPYTPDAAQIAGDRPLHPGQTVAYRVPHGEPKCAGDHPAPGPVQVEVTSGGHTVTVDPGESADLIRRMLQVDCAQARILDTITIRFDTEWDVHRNGNEQQGTLLIERRADGPAVTLTGVRGGINYTLEMLQPESRPTLGAADQSLAIPVRSRGARCDGHAMGDNSKPFGFSAWLSLDGGPETLIEFTADDQPDNFVRLCSGN